MLDQRPTRIGFIPFCLQYRGMLAFFTIVWLSFAAMDVAKNAYFRGAHFELWRQCLQALYIFLPWIAIGMFAGWLYLRWPWHSLASAITRSRDAARHLFVALGIGGVHILIIASSFWLFWPQRVATVSFNVVLVEQGLKWLHFELVIYAACHLLWHGYWHWRAKPQDEVSANDDDALAASAAEPLLIASDGVMQRVAPEEIDWIQADDNYVILYCGDRRIRMRETLSKVLTKLDAGHFQQVHRSAVVNLSKIRSIQSARLLLMDGQRVPVSRRRRTELTRLLKPHA